MKKKKCPKSFMRFLLLFNFIAAFVADILNYEEYFQLFIVIVAFIMLIKHWNDTSDVNCW